MEQQFDVHQNGGNTASVGDTAAAALAYHQMTVPQATELQFQTQGSSGDSFSMGDHHQNQTGMQDFSLEALKAATQTGRSGQSAPSESPPQSASHKPTVGSEEWHKVRRDNHKEGKHLRSCAFAMTNLPQSNAVDAKPSTRALTSWPKLFPDAKRTRAPFCSAPSSSSLNLRRMSNRISRSGRSRSFLLSRPSRSLVRVATNSRPNVNEPGMSAKSTSAHAKMLAFYPTKSKSARRMASSLGPTQSHSADHASLWPLSKLRSSVMSFTKPFLACLWQTCAVSFFSRIDWLFEPTSYAVIFPSHLWHVLFYNRRLFNGEHSFQGVHPCSRSRSSRR